MKIPPKILKHHVKLSGKETPNTTSSEPIIIKPTPAVDNLKPAPKPIPVAQAGAKIKLKPELKPQASKNIPKPTPVITKPEIKKSPEITVSKPDPIPKPTPTPVPVTTATPTSVEKPAIEEVVAEEVAPFDEPIAKPFADAPFADAPFANAQDKQDKPVASAKSAKQGRRASRIEKPKTATNTLAKRIQNQTQLQKTPESLPVLEAFQEFLDSEQRKMRRRMIGLSVFFTVVILLLITGALAGAFFLINPMKTDVNSIQSAIASLETNSTTSSENTASTISKLNEMIENERASLRDTTSEIETKVNSYGGNLTEVKDLITNLQDENTILKTQLKTINRDLPDVTYKIAAIMNEIDKMRAPRAIAKKTPASSMRSTSTTGSRPTAPPRQPAAIVRKPAEHTYSAMISFVPTGKEKRVICLLPIPE